MVALAPEHAPKTRPSPPKNRVGDFFWPTPDRAGPDRSGTRTVAGKNGDAATIERRGSALPQKKDPCDELREYMRRWKTSSANLKSQIREYSAENWDAIRRGAGDGLSIGKYFDNGGIIPFAIDNHANVGATGSMLIAAHGEEALTGATSFVQNQLYATDGLGAAELGRKSQAIRGIGTAATRTGQVFAIAGATARADMAAEAFRRGDWTTGAHYSVTGFATGWTANTAFASTPFGRGFAWGVSLGGFAEGALWDIVDAPVVESLEAFQGGHDRLVQYGQEALRLWRAHGCE